MFHPHSTSAKLLTRIRSDARVDSTILNRVVYMETPIVSRTPVTTANTDAQVLGPNSLNTHFFDGKIQYALDTIIPYIDAAKKVTATEKLSAFSTLRMGIVDRRALHCFDIIVRDLDGFGRVRASGNYDSANNVYACDLLYACTLIPTSEMVSLLESQLIDMNSGLCPQGRTTRLIQCLWSLTQN